MYEGWFFSQDKTGRVSLTRASHNTTVDLLLLPVVRSARGTEEWLAWTLIVTPQDEPIREIECGESLEDAMFQAIAILELER